MTTLKVNEIFYSIQGESSYAGFPTVFIRTSGCHLRCGYCDTKYAYYDGKKMTIEEILSEVKVHNTKYICVTGGEPLLQKPIYPLLSALCDLNYHVSLETSGTISCHLVDTRVKLILDVKTPGSGVKENFHLENLKFSGGNAEFKFVITSQEDFNWAEDFVKKNKLNISSNVLYSPAFNKISEKWLAKKILSEKSSARLQLQLHKYIWSSQSRGV